MPDKRPASVCGRSISHASEKSVPLALATPVRTRTSDQESFSGASPSFVHCASAREKISAEIDKGLCSLQRGDPDHSHPVLRITAHSAAFGSLARLMPLNCIMKAANQLLELSLCVICALAPTALLTVNARQAALVEQESTSFVDRESISGKVSAKTEASLTVDG